MQDYSVKFFVLFLLTRTLLQTRGFEHGFRPWSQQDPFHTKTWTREIGLWKGVIGVQSW